LVRSRLAARENFLGAFYPEELGRAGLHFDAITVIEVIEHLYDEDLEALLQSVHRIINRDGIVIFTTPNEEQLEEASVWCPYCEKVFHRWQHVRSWSETELRRYLESKGFDIVASFTTDFNRKRRRKPKNWRLVKWCKALGLRWVKRTNLRVKKPHLAVVCQPSGQSGSWT
jgi:2-polyprenyl-3-methyl-5-hydroxy-6-metoxy-1,4-benzoquinol methylase